MDNVKHTPGPWESKKVKTQIGWAFKINEPGNNDNYGLVACIYDDNTTLNKRPSAEHEANAQLISAAPELLRACKKLMRCGYRAKHGWIKCAPDDSDLELLDAAITKAEGS